MLPGASFQSCGANGGQGLVPEPSTLEDRVPRNRRNRRPRTLRACFLLLRRGWAVAGPSRLRQTAHRVQVLCEQATLSGHIVIPLARCAFCIRVESHARRQGTRVRHQGSAPASWLGRHSKSAKQKVERKATAHCHSVRTRHPHRCC